MRAGNNKCRIWGAYLVIAKVAEFPVPQQKMNHQQQDDVGMAKDRTDIQVFEASAQPVFQGKMFEPFLKDYQAEKRGKSLVLKTKDGKGMDFAVNL